MAVSRTSTGNLQIISRPFSSGCDPAAKGSANDLEVAGAGPAHCHFSLLPTSFFTMCSSECCLSFILPWHIDHLK